MSDTVCGTNGGVWANGEPCGMDSPRGRRCDWHQGSIEAALAAAVRTGVIDVTTGQVRLDYGEDRLTREAVELLTEIGVLSRVGAPWAPIDTQDEQHRLRGLIAAATALTFVLWDLVTAPGTDASLQLAELVRPRLAALTEALGARLARACRWAALEVYRDMPGKSWPYPMIRHRCEERYSGSDRTCECPALYEWEFEALCANDEADGA